MSTISVELSCDNFIDLQFDFENEMRKDENSKDTKEQSSREKITHEMKQPVKKLSPKNKSGRNNRSHDLDQSGAIEVICKMPVSFDKSDTHSRIKRNYKLKSQKLKSNIKTPLPK